MRMRDLEKSSGVSRETIRFYIRERLLPEPSRTHRNSATYTNEHLARLLTIRRLKDERFLPLSVIRTILSGDHAAWAEPQVLPEIDHQLRERLDAGGEYVDAAEFILQNGGNTDHLEEVVQAGLINPRSDGKISPRDQRIMRLLMDGQRIGFTRERGYGGSEGTGRLAQIMHELAEIEIHEFFAHVAPHVGDLEAADMAEHGIGIYNKLMTELFTREVLSLLSERRRIANDNRTEAKAAQQEMPAQETKVVRKRPRKAD